MLGLRFRARALSICGKWGPLLIAVRGPPTIAASLVAEHRLQTRRLSSCGSRAQSLRGTWDPPRPGPEPVSPALAGRLPTTAPPGKPTRFVLINAMWAEASTRFPSLSSATANSEGSYQEGGIIVKWWSFQKLRSLSDHGEQDSSSPLHPC